jgi:polyphosphate:AMP phosphotransferase
MFESAELGRAVDADTFAREASKLRAELLHAQADVFRHKEFPVIVLVSGIEAAGKGDTLRVMHEWLDTRHIQTHAFDAPDCVEGEHPAMWRFWEALPRSGDLGIFFRAWYKGPVDERVYGGMSSGTFERKLDEILRFERMLTDEGALVLKLWLHLSKKAQRKKLEALSADRETRWRVKKSDWRNHAHYDRILSVAEVVLRRTSTQHAPWALIDAKDDRNRRLTVMRTLLDAMRARLSATKKVHVHAPPITARVDRTNLLRSLDLDQKLAEKAYEKRLGRASAALADLSRKAAKEKRAVVLVFEGSDAAGKGGAIRRVTAALDARHFQVTSIAAPTEEERAHPYLWRFWRAVPRDGRVAIYDRSWYGRVLVERVEGFAEESAWMRAYSEINDFEAQMTEHGIVVAKFWLAISKAEQLRRFKSREDEAYKRFKITQEDWRNRKKWDAYERAACDMFERTSTKHAPWTLVEANDKLFARVKVLETVVARLGG